MEFLIKFRTETANRQISDEAEFYIGHYGLIETLEPITNLSVVVSRTVNDELDICGSMTMTKLRRGDWGWSSIRLYSVDRRSFDIHRDEKVFEEQFQKGDEPKNLFQSLKEFQYDHEHEKLEAGVIYELRHPVVLKAQTSSDREYYCWGGNKYGATHSFYITGVVTSSR